MELNTNKHPILYIAKRCCISSLGPVIQLPSQPQQLEPVKVRPEAPVVTPVWLDLGGSILWICNTANISKFSDSENAPKNLENMCNYASIFYPGNGGKI